MPLFFSSSLMVSMTDLFLSNILSYKGISLFFMLLLSPVTRLMPSLYNLSKSPWDTYPLSANNFPTRLSLSLLNTLSSLSSTFALVNMKLTNSPRSLQVKCSLKLKYHPIVLFPIEAYSLNTLLRRIRLLWHTGMDVLSMKLIPVQRPRQHTCRNSIISTAILDSSSMKRL